MSRSESIFLINSRVNIDYSTNAFDDDQLTTECLELYLLAPSLIVAFIKQSIEILLMMKDEEYEDAISKERKRNQKLTSILDRKKSPRHPEENFVQMIKNKILENKRFRFDKEYLDISTFNDYSQVSTSIDNPSLGRHKDGTKKFGFQANDTPAGNTAVQGDGDKNV